MSIISFIENNIRMVVPVGGLGFLATVSGIAYLSNTHQQEKNYLFRRIPETSENQLEAADGKHFSEFELVRHSYKDLIAGDKNFNDGNYVLYYGSQACPNCTKFLYGDSSLAKGSFWVERDKMSYGSWMSAFKYTKVDETLKDKKIAFIMYEDIPVRYEYSYDDDMWTLPWSKWDKNDVRNGRVIGEYKRHDESARNFRKINDYAVSVFGQEKANGIPSVIIYKSGRPVVWLKDTLPGLNDKNEKKDSLGSEDLELKRWIKYYYDWIK